MKSTHGLSSEQELELKEERIYRPYLLGLGVLTLVKTLQCEVNF